MFHFHASKTEDPLAIWHTLVLRKSECLPESSGQGIKKHPHS